MLSRVVFAAAGDRKHINMESTANTTTKESPVLPLIEAVKTRLLQLYEPTRDFIGADVRMSTQEIYVALQRFSPGAYGLEEISAWMNQWGFCFVETKPLEFVWLLKNKVV